MKTSSEIRREYIDFFLERGHTRVPSAPVVPKDDPTLLFVNAGMNQFKDVFLGTGSRDYSRAVNSQKCIRVSGKHNDLEAVGRDTYHHTFFEMLGNWSFGDYGKRESIRWAWELLTGVWKLPVERLYATVHLEDDESAELWESETGIDPGRIFRFDKDNFWEMGDVGPCGPCSEIHMDVALGKQADPKLAGDPDHGINSGDPRFIEIWNLVFIRSERHPDGTLTPLKEAHVDTGMGFERICAVLQGKASNYDTDVFQPLIGRVAGISGREYGPGEEGTPHRVIADHVRMLSFALADGAVPSNEGRGYVVRRILRRAARFGRELGIREPFLHGMTGLVGELMGDVYPEVVKRAGHIERVILAEEESFGATLDRGLELFAETAEKAEKGGGVISGEEAFRLYDTYGFPFDLTVLMARERGLRVDEQGFRSHMEERREQSRAEGGFSAADKSAGLLASLPDGASSEFAGYDHHCLTTAVIGADDRVIILDRTPLYPEGGGQVADTGVIEGDSFRFEVEHVRRAGSLILHEGTFTQGGSSDAAPGTEARAAIESETRRDTQRNHTATHLLHRALFAILGDNATQAGSLVAPGYMRFDFHHYDRLDDETLLELEKLVNREIRANRTVSWRVTDHEKALAEGAMALFGEKYEQRVRVVEIEGFSRELCGGTHVSATGELGAFAITSESSVAAGIRRIEALTGSAASEYLLGRSHLVDRVSRTFSIQPDELEERIAGLLEEQKALGKQLAQLKKEAGRGALDQLIDKAQSVAGGVRVVAEIVDETDMDALKGLGDSFREKCGSGAALFGAERDGKLVFVCAVTDDLVKDGRLKAGELVGRVARIAGGGGGGRPHLATAGGKDVARLGEAVEAFRGLVEERLGR